MKFGHGPGLGRQEQVSARLSVVCWFELDAPGLQQNQQYKNHNPRPEHTQDLTNPLIKSKLRRTLLCKYNILT